MTKPKNEGVDITGEIVRPVAKPIRGAICPEIAVEMIEELAPLDIPHHPGVHRPPLAGGI